MRGTYYPDLVRAFYFNYKFRDGVGFTKVKGVDIILDDDIWENVAQFPIHDATSPIITAGIEGIILDTMLKANRLPQYPLPYSLLISRICEYKGVNVSDEQSHNTTKANKIAENSLKQMKFIPFGNTYIHKDDMPSSDNEEEENPPTAPIPPIDTNIGSSSGVGGSSSSLDHILNLNQRLEEFFLLSTHRHEEVTGLIRGLDSRISNLEHKFDKYDEGDDMS
ncbi:hypothetical protein DEO72_LG2g3345 [Vigna unguiculata]|uniref:Uncharacterized protein n=1 Tax=Vigna unguiculata TaxID=3917 RepID=A0A4D6L3C7_VIGUN|nr:hypothetical protein DEO72_LG2g3345 [Vigna unguiculata]